MVLVTSKIDKINLLLLFFSKSKSGKPLDGLLVLFDFVGLDDEVEAVELLLFDEVEVDASTFGWSQGFDCFQFY